MRLLSANNIYKITVDGRETIIERWKIQSEIVLKAVKTFEIAKLGGRTSSTMNLYVEGRYIEMECLS
jgi:hypothetical protein